MLIEEGRVCETWEEQSKETIMQPWGMVLVPHQGINTAMSLNCFADTEIPTWWEKLTFGAHRPICVCGLGAWEPLDSCIICKLQVTSLLSSPVLSLWRTIRAPSWLEAL